MAKEKKKKSVSVEKDSSKGEELKKGKEEEKILKMIFIIAGLAFLAFFTYYLFIQSQSNFNYKGLKFESVKMGEIQLYPLVSIVNNSQGKPIMFNLRTNPNELKKVPFESYENLRLLVLNVIGGQENMTFKCGGDGVIAVANLQILFSNMGMDLIKDENATCDPEGRYNYFTLKYGDETRIEEVGPACYDIIIKGDEESCEILPATEKLMVEAYLRYYNLKR